MHHLGSAPTGHGDLSSLLSLTDVRGGMISRVVAESWQQGLVTGNGHMGALLYGAPAEQHLLLNRAGLFMPMNPRIEPVDLRANLGELRELLARGEYQRAADRVVEISVEQGYPNETIWTDPFIPGFELILAPEIHGKVRAYCRSVDFLTGVCTSVCEDDLGPLIVRVFASRADRAVVVSLCRVGEARFTGRIRLRLPPHDRGDAAGTSADLPEGVSRSSVEAQPPWLSGRVDFARAYPGSLRGHDTLIRAHTEGGNVQASADCIELVEARAALLLCRIEPFSVPEHSALGGLQTELSGLETDFEALLAEHCKVHGPVMNRVRLDLGGCDHERPSEELLAEANEHRLSSTLIEKQFLAARYAIYCSSGALFPTLQGIWNGSWSPPWCSDFTHDGNVPTAISAGLSTDLPECLAPYFRYHRARLADYRKNAHNHYGCRGILIPSRSSSHGLDIHFGPTWCLTFWTAGAAWAAHYFYDYFLYTYDQEFLARQALPFMQAAVEFYQDFLVPGPDGKLHFTPSYSPENAPLGSTAQAAVDATMDLAVTRELLGNLLDAWERVGGDPQTKQRYEDLLARLPEYAIGEDGVLKEWLLPELRDNHDHRHLSHLYALYAGLPEDIEADSGLRTAFAQAAKRRLEVRRREGGGVMGFGLAMLGWVAASLRDSDMASEILNWLGSKFWGPSLTTTHDPGHLFNVDLGGGYPALIAQMLLDSRPGSLTLLPACPATWPSGSVNGLRARGDVRLDRLSWQAHKVEVQLTTGTAQRLVVRLGPSVKVRQATVGDADPRALGNGSVEIDLVPHQPVILTLT